MCGRTACTLSAPRMRRVANIRSRLAAVPSPAAAGSGASVPAGKISTSGGIPPTDVYRKFNISPTGVLPIVVERAASGERQVLLAEWGLRPPTHHLPQSPTTAKSAAFPYSSFNARVEGLTTSKLYKRLLNSRRCVLVVDGFYEWKKDPSDPKKKQPFFIRMRPAFQETPIPLRRGKTAEEQLQDGFNSSGSCCSKSGSKAEQRHESHLSHHTRQPAAATTADDDGQQQQQHQSGPPSSAAGKRRRGSVDVKSEPSSSSSGSTPATEAKEEATRSASSGAGSEGAHSSAGAAADQKEKVDFEGAKDADEDGERGTLQRGEAPLLLAGLYDFLYTAAEETNSSRETSDNSSTSSSVPCSVTILTMSSEGTPLADLHTRMPVALSPEAAAIWLDCASTPFDACIKDVTDGSIALYRDGVFFYAVTPRMGNSRYEAPDCTEPLGAGAAAGAAAAGKKKQQFLFFASQGGGETKRMKHAEAAEPQQVTKSERQQVMEIERRQHQQRQFKKEEQSLSHHEHQQQHVEKTEEKEEQEPGSSKDATKRKGGQATARSAHTTGMKSMDHFFKRAAHKKQSQ